MKTKLIINGQPATVDFSPAETLLTVLRRSGYTEVKSGCEDGECGACLVFLNNRLVNACQVLMGSAVDAEVTTIRGLSEEEVRPVQEAFIEAGAVQCGFCTPGMILATVALLRQNPSPSDADIRRGLDGNLCRCTGYVKIAEAVKEAVERRRQHA